MTTGERPSIVDAAREWIATGTPATGSQRALGAALQDLVDNRYRGGAPKLRDIHALRQRLLGDPTPLRETSDAAEGPWDGQELGRAAAHSATPEQGRLLYQLTRALQPAVVVELGTNIGISAAYIAAALHLNGRGRLTTLEASGLRLVLARRHLAELGLGSVELVEGYFDDTLPEVLGSLPPVDLAFVDGNHMEDATLRYFDLLCSHASGEGVIVFDDIRWSDGMWHAWQTIAGSPRVATAVDLGRTGITLLP